MAEVGAALQKGIYVDGPDGAAVWIGNIDIPLHLAMDPPLPDVAAINVRVRTGEPQVTVKVHDHAGCAADLKLSAYVAVGGDRLTAGELTCCDTCRPRRSSPAGA
jgi:hypothetical protein